MKRVLVIIFLFFLVITIFEVVTSLGLFESAQNVVINTDIGRWQVLINDSSIKEETTFEVSNVIVDNEENVLENRLAPGTEGYFEVEIVPNDSSVAFRYDVTYSWDLVDNSKIQFLSVEETTDHDIVRTGEKTYSGIISLDDIADENNVNIRFNLQWINDDNNNDSDSEYGLSKKELIIPISVHLSQYLGEELVEYSG